MRRIAEFLNVGVGTVWGAMKRADIPRHDPHSLPGDANPAWKGGRWIDKDGYVMIHSPSHPFASNGYMREHRLVMEEALGRYLLPSEVVHHKDKDKQNNSAGNLELFSRNSDHLRHELTGKIPKWTQDGKRRISEANRNKKRLPISEETRQRMRESQQARAHLHKPHSEETRQRMRESQQARAHLHKPHSDETRRRIGLAHKGKRHPHSAASIEKLRQSALRREATKRNGSAG